MRPKARSSRLLRRATQVQARTQQLAAEDGRDDDLLLVTHVMSLAGPPAGPQPAGTGPVI